MDDRTFIALGFLLAMAIGILGVFFASQNPDGLEGTLLVITGRKTLTGDAPADSPGPDHPSPLASILGSFRGITSGKLGDTLAIALGTLLIFAGAFAVSRAILKRRTPEEDRKAG